MPRMRGKGYHFFENGGDTSLSKAMALSFSNHRLWHRISCSCFIGDCARQTTDFGATWFAPASVAVVLADARAVRTDTRKLKCVFHTYFSVI